MKFFHQGQFEGRKKRITPHLIRGPIEAPDAQLAGFYHWLLELLKSPVFDGKWQLGQAREAWQGNWTAEDFVVYQWTHAEHPTLMIIVNYSSHRSQCFVPIPSEKLNEARCSFKNLRTGESWQRDTHAVKEQGHYFDLGDYEAIVIEIA